MYVYISRLSFKIKDYVRQNNFKGSSNLPFNTTKRQTYLCYTPVKLKFCLCQCWVVPHNWLNHTLVNLHASCKLWPGLTGWLVKSGYTVQVRMLKAKNSIRKEHYQCPMFQILMDFETWFFFPKTKWISSMCYETLFTLGLLYTTDYWKTSPCPGYHFLLQVGTGSSNLFQISHYQVRN